MREHFQAVAWPEHISSALWLDGGTFPVHFSLNPEASVTITCEGEVEVELPGGFMLIAQTNGWLTFRTGYLGIQVETLTAPLILEAADNQGIPVGHRCSETCTRR